MCQFEPRAGSDGIDRPEHQQNPDEQRKQPHGTRLCCSPAPVTVDAVIGFHTEPDSGKQLVDGHN